MTDQQKKYIENNIELIENEKWDEFFKMPPVGTGGVLYEAGIHFLKGIHYVPRGAFYESNIRTIDIPDNITSVGTAAFYYCTSLTSITIPDSVTSIGNHAFFCCTSLTSITIGNSVSSIGNWAFSTCSSLKSITIPNSVRSIDDWAFNACGDIKINYNGTTDEWKTLIDNNSRVFKNTTYTCTCTDGVVRKSR